MTKQLQQLIEEEETHKINEDWKDEQLEEYLKYNLDD